MTQIILQTARFQIALFENYLASRWKNHSYSAQQKTLLGKKYCFIRNMLKIVSPLYRPQRRRNTRIERPRRGATLPGVEAVSFPAGSSGGARTRTTEGEYDGSSALHARVDRVISSAEIVNDDDVIIGTTVKSISGLICYHSHLHSFWCLVLVLLMVVIIPFILIFFSKATDNEEVLSQSFLTLREEFFRISEHALFDRGSPQFRALKWLANSNITDVGDLHSNALLQRYVMAVLYFSTSGHEWTKKGNFLNEEKHVCEWGSVISSPRSDCEGPCIICDEESKSIIHISLTSNGLIGTIPKEISELGKLQSIFMDRNILRGTIPPSLQRLQNLTAFFAGQNRLSGTLPDFSNWHSIEQIHLWRNQLNGTLDHVGFEHMKSLRYLSVAVNKFEGEIPQELFNLPELETLFLVDNGFQGTLPDLNENTKNLQVLYLSHNNITSTLDKSICKAENLKILSLINNKFTGTIPECIASLPLQELLLSENNFVGDVHTICDSNLRVLQVDCTVNCTCCDGCI